MYQNHINLANMLTKNADKVLTKANLVCMEFTSIERKNFDLWQMSYAPRSSLRSLRYASQKSKQTQICEPGFHLLYC